MLIDINLLPRKEKKQRKPLFGFFLIFIIFSSTIAIMVFQIQMKKQNVATLSNKLQTTQENRIEANSGIEEQIRSLESLKTAVDWANDSKIRIVPILQHLIERLPERGFIQALSYHGEGNMKLTVQFDTSRQAAFYLTELNNSSWIKDARISTITTSEIQDENPLLRYITEYELVLDYEKNKTDLSETRADRGEE